MPIDPRRVKELFVAARDIAAGPVRVAFLEEECAGDREVRELVEVLLEAHDRSVRAPDQPPAGGPDLELTVEHQPRWSELSGTVVAGRYKLQEQIGEGGMGSVWVAEQSEPVRRRVALKLIKPGMDTRQVLSRFDAERQALALMDHPHIAKVLDAGTTASGRPFFVMELVKGIPLTQFCDDHKLGVLERLNLFQQVCSAVQHAHQKGIIHRDLKPSNILVESHDGKPMPKVIDFGLAKAIGGLQLTELTLNTGFGTVVGTPLYMAPEQAAFNALDVDTRADVFALGVILYELLTGTTPIERETFRKAAFEEILRVIREQEPPTPSSRIIHCESRASVAALRQTEPARLSRFVNGELDWIVMKSLSKGRDRRYDSATAFAKDVERFLNHEPVLAGPPSAAYKLRKFAQRNRPQVIAAGLVLVALMAGMTGTTFGLIRAERALDGESQQRVIAQRREREAKASERLARQREQEEKKAREQAEEVSQFMRRVFAQGSAHGQASKTRGVNRTLTVKEAMDFAAKAIEAKFADRPEIEAALRTTIGQTYLELGAFSDAELHFKKALELREQRLSAEHVETLACVNNLATLYLNKRDFTAAEPLLKRALAGFEKAFDVDHADTLMTINNLSMVYLNLGNYEAAEPLIKKALAGFEKTLGADDAKTLMSVNNLAQLNMAKRDYAAAEPLLKRALAGTEKTLSASHPNTLTALNNLAEIYLQQRDYDAAIPLLVRALAGAEAALEPNHPDTLGSINNLAFLYQEQQNYAAAEPLLKRALAGCEKTFGANDSRTLLTAANLGVNYSHTGQLEEAIQLLERAYNSHRRHPTLAGIANPLLEAYAKAEKRTEAARLVAEILAENRPRLKPDSPDLGGLLAFAGKTLLDVDPAAAEPVLRECLAIREKLAAESWNTANAKSLLGGSLLQQKKYDEAGPLLVAGYEGMKADEQAMPPQAKSNIPDAIQRLVDLYDATGKPEEAAKWRKMLAAEPPVK